MDEILLTGYIILLLIAAVYAGVIIYHILKYHHEDISPRRVAYSKKALWTYIIIGTSTLVISIGLAIIFSNA